MPPLANSMYQRLRNREYRSAVKIKLPAKVLLRRLGPARLDKQANRALLQNDPDDNLTGIDRKIDHIMRNPKAIPIEVLFPAQELIVVPVSSDSEAGSPSPEPQQAPVAIADAPPPDPPASLIPPNTPVDDTGTQSLVLPPTPRKPDLSTGPKPKPAGSRRPPGFRRKISFVPGPLVPWTPHRESSGVSVRYCKKWNNKKPCPDNCRYHHACSKCRKPFKKHAAKQCPSEPSTHQAEELS